METLEKLTVPDVIITLYPLENTIGTGAMPGSGPGIPADGKDKKIINVDLNVYFSESCCYEVIAVQSADTRKQNGVFITDDKNGFSYVPDLRNGYWGNVDDYDIIEYCVRDIKTEQTALGTVTLQVIENAAFKAVDVCVNFGKDTLLDEEPLALDLSLVNKFEYVEIEEIGDFNKKLISGIVVNPDKSSELLVWLNPQCNNWHIDTRTEVEYAISALVDGNAAISKGKIFFRYVEDLFFAKFIRIQVSEPMPPSIMINVRDYNPLFAEIQIEKVDETPLERGIIGMMNPFHILYTFNLASDYWIPAEAQDTFRYTLYNPTTGKSACSYVQIVKSPNNTSGSGSGSGSGVGGNYESIFGGTLTMEPGGPIYAASGMLNTPSYPIGTFSGMIEYKGLTAAGHRYDILSGSFVGFTVFSGKLYSTTPPGGSIMITGGEIYYQ